MFLLLQGPNTLFHLFLYQFIHSMQKSSSAVKVLLRSLSDFILTSNSCILHICTRCSSRSLLHTFIALRHTFGAFLVFVFVFMYFAHLPLNVWSRSVLHTCIARQRAFGAFFVTPAQHFLRLTQPQLQAQNTRYCNAVSKSLRHSYSFAKNRGDMQCAKCEMQRHC